MSKTTETTDATNPEDTTSEEAAGAAGSDAAESETDLGAAGSQLSTAPREDPVSSLPAMGVIGWIRWFWRQLTSMRVALLLLLLLSLGAIPGSLIPQTSIDELKVTDFKAKHDVLAPIYDKLGLFHVYSSVWFSAIYILLFISLIGCIVPRTWQFVGQLRGRPPGAPKRLTRLPAYTTWRTESEPEAVRDAALAMLKKRRFRAHITEGAVASEKGFLRETGNLLFHIALIVLLVSFASGQLWKSEGGKLVVDGDGFSNTLTQYDDFKAGTLFDPDKLAPFSFTLDKFIGTYEKNGPNRGTPRKYEAHVTYSEGAEGKDKKGVIKVNTPLEVDGSKVYLVSHGYAPIVSVKDPKGKEIYRDAVPLLPLDSNATSTGAIKVMDGYRNAAGKKEQLGFQTMFVPTYAGKGKGTMFSTFPGLDFPVMAVSGFHGDLGVNSGLPQSVYQLNSKHMTQYKDSKGNKLAKLLLPGETMKLPHGEGSIQFVGVKQWASFKISHQPGTDFALVGALAAIAGLAGSLFIQRRRIWVRAVRGEDGVTVVEMAGLGRSESAKLPEELADLAATLHSVAPSAPDSAASAETPEGAEK
ncbi:MULTISPECIES: cytochrome c biogenesis protein ResB [unclassified Streptomyces]|uniref:cytochrome c biogenesis protein ResB n=1 Tax=unclassified Streptomyces TaxID=2593676 RepID=UPI002E1060EB|nr:cytochrome c biogenesis protein ResB [Streptomyces sp. NBC_01197]WSS50892.1 cytochrome c biogenesis protein ResB [Streptomyces sp. NBC_01180]